MHKKIVYLEFNVHCFTNKSYTLSIQYTLHDYSSTVQHKEYVIIIHINHSHYPASLFRSKIFFCEKKKNFISFTFSSLV